MTAVNAKHRAFDVATKADEQDVWSGQPLEDTTAHWKVIKLWIFVTFDITSSLYMLQLLLATSSEARPNDVGSHSALIENNRQSESFLSLRFSTPDPYFFRTEIFELQFTECAVRSCHLKHLGPHCRQWRSQEFDLGGGIRFN